jgi:hypothetical protein
MGAFEKDDNSKIRPQKQTAKGGYLIDLLGRRVSDKGYLIDQAGNVVDRDQKVLFSKSDLKNGEFPKIFSFTKFNVRRSWATSIRTPTDSRNSARVSMEALWTNKSVL